jgi:hypothetical protein
MPINRRAALCLALPGTLLSGCGLPKLFELAIDEEVQLHDGSILLLNTKVQFQRTSIFSKYENAMRRVTTLTFDTGSPARAVTFTTWLHPVMLDRVNDNWYLVLSGQGPFGKTDESGHLWGHDFTTHLQRLAILEGRVFRAATWDTAPPSILRENLYPMVETSVLAELNGKRVSLAEKDKLLQDQFLDPNRRQITRPQHMAIPVQAGSK